MTDTRKRKPMTVLPNDDDTLTVVTRDGATSYTLTDVENSAELTAGEKAFLRPLFTEAFLNSLFPPATACSLRHD